MFIRAIAILDFLSIIYVVYGIDIRKCPPLRLPANGYVVCDHLIGAFCAPVCNPGFVHETQPAEAYVCNPLRKAWATYPGGYPLPWPNCIRSTTRDTIAKSEPAIKKSIVDQQNVHPSEQGTGAGKNSLWQRMLTLTSQLTQSKLKEATAGAARSVQSKSSSPSGVINNKVIPADTSVAQNTNVYNGNTNDNIPNTNTNTQSTNLYNYNANIYNANAYPNGMPASLNEESPAEKQLHFRRLQQYWDTYYKRYYESLGVGKMPDWMTRSPWSNDPERVEGALDIDTVGKEDVPGNNTAYQNWNSYLQNYYQYPTPPRSNDTAGADTDNSTFAPPNSSSDSFIENVIENDLFSKNLMDKTLNRDLYYEDQLIHDEEKTRPRLNTTRKPSTTRTATTLTTTATLATTATTTSRPQLQTTASSYYKTTLYPYATQNSSQYTYNSSAYGQESTQSVTSANALPTQNDSSVAQVSRADLTDTNSASQGAQTSSQSQGYNASSDPYTAYTYLYNQYLYKSQSGSSASNSGNVVAAASQAPTSTTNTSTGRTDSTLKAGSAKNSTGNTHKTLKPVSLQKLVKLAANDDSQDQQLQAYDSDDDDDNNDYLEQLDISSLVRELIKLETIRKQRQLSRRKKIQQENSKAVANLLVGDLFHGFFKNKKPISQKALKKHLLHKGRRLVKSKGNQSPLPKFNR